MIISISSTKKYKEEREVNWIKIENGTVYLYNNALHLIDGIYCMHIKNAKLGRNIRRKIYPFRAGRVIIHHVDVGDNGVFIDDSGNVISGKKCNPFHALTQYRIWLSSQMKGIDLSERKRKRVFTAGRLTKNHPMLTSA